MKSKVDEMASMFDVFITSMTLCELYKGAYLHVNSCKQAEEVESCVSFFEVIDLDVSSYKEFGKMFAKLQKEGKMTNEFELMIASIAKTNGLTLVTRDKKHFENTGVELEVW